MYLTTHAMAQSSQRSISVTRYDVVIVGAGPYRLSTAAHFLGTWIKGSSLGKAIATLV